jgi:cytochrome c biogenesis protein CcmG/thiol:disulfide interchange protein DsbE
MQDKGSAERKGKELGSSWGKVLAWALVLALLAIVAVQLRSSQQGVMGRGEAAPEFTLTTFDGDKLSKADMVGKVVVLNFWASWCKPCEQEAEELQLAWEHYEGRGDVLFLGADYVDTEKEALAYLERFEITYPNGPDLGTRIAQAFRLRGVPETYFINKAGEIAFVQIGPFVNIEEIQSLVDSLLDL